MFPRRSPIPHGVTGFGVGTLGYAAYNARRNQANNGVVNDQQNTIANQNQTIADQSQIIADQQQTISDQQGTIQSQQDHIRSLADKTSSSSSSDQAGPSSSSVQGSSSSSSDQAGSIDQNNLFGDVESLFNEFFESISNLDLTQLILLFNIISSILLLNILISVLLSKYGDYLIEKFKLADKYPKLSKLILYRTKVQGIYFKYATILAFASLFFNLFINISILLN